MLRSSEFRHLEHKQDSVCPDKFNVTLGIIKEFRNKHKYYVKACEDMGVPYKILGISGPDWVQVVKNSGCDGFLVRPSAKLTAWKQMYDERLKVIVEELGKIIYPTYDETWLYESKRRMCYWLEANGIPHPMTWIFYSLDEALEFANTAELPIVYKSDFGAGASGVKIFRRRLPLLLFIRKCFKSGFVRSSGDRRDRQWGSVFFQEYLADVKEWRVIRIGMSYFGYQKGKRGDFHSGSGLDNWCNPPKRLLDFVRSVTNKGRFTSMALDIFETTDGRYLVNELQSLFGSYTESQMYINGKPGRYIYELSSGNWIFEEGVFCQNGSCNLRVETFLGLLDVKKQSSQQSGIKI